MEQVTNPDGVSSVISPFYVLYDLRVAYSHLGSQEGNEEKLQFVRERLGVSSEAGLLKIYNVLIEQLGNSYDKFTSFVKEKT
jgi:hypothetical protein